MQLRKPACAALGTLRVCWVGWVLPLGRSKEGRVGHSRLGSGSVVTDTLGVGFQGFLSCQFLINSVGDGVVEWDVH